MPAPRNRPSPSGSPRIPHEVCWAKTDADGSPGISVADHCINVGCVAEQLIQRMPVAVRHLIPAGVVTLAAAHDIGKVSPGFQGKCPAWVMRQNLPAQFVAGCETDHAKTSQFTLQSKLGHTLRHWAAVIGAHHGRIKGDRIPYISESDHETWAVERNRLTEELIDIFGPLPSQAQEEAIYWCSAGLITVSDWIGSDELRFPQEFRGPVEERRTLAQTAMRSIGWELHVPKTGLSFCDLFPSYQPNALQQAAWDHVTAPGLYIIEGPMGCGKTEAALAAAYRLLEKGLAAGIYFALPTQVTSNRIFLRIQPFVDSLSETGGETRLMHGNAWLLEEISSIKLRAGAQSDEEMREHIRAGRSWFSSAKRAILAPFGVGTIDQALLGIVAAKHFFVRQFGLAGKVVILDEVHSYDLYTGTLIDLMVQRLLELNCTVVILSATLTAARRQQLLDLKGNLETHSSRAYPLLTCKQSSVSEVSVPGPPPQQVSLRFMPASSLVGEVLGAACTNQCVLWIRNTVAEAQETFALLKSATHEGGPDIGLLHSRFPQFRREELESFWLDRLGKDGRSRPARGCVLVATQVVEQSVDIDADLLVSDLAPSDMLLQRIGRLWRHARHGRPCSFAQMWLPDLDIPAESSVSEIMQLLGRSARVYAPYVLLRTWQEWRCRSSIILPNQLRDILEATYSEPPEDEPDAWQALRADLEQRKAALRAQAVSATNVWFQPSLLDDEGVQTRYSQCATANLVVVRHVERLNSTSDRVTFLNGTVRTADARDWNIDTARAVHRNLVRVPYWMLKAALQQEQCAWLRLHAPNTTALGMLGSMGVIETGAVEQTFALSYCAERGILVGTKEGVGSEVGSRWDDEDESYD